MEEQNNRNEIGENEQNYSPVQKERVGRGIIGAFAGSLIGVIVIVLLGKFGYVASLSGVVMGFCTLKGYQIMAKGFSKKGLIICVILMILMGYISNSIIYAPIVAESYEEFGATPLLAFFMMPLFLRYPTSDYYGIIIIKGLIMVYLFTGLGAAPVIKNHFKK